MPFSNSSDTAKKCGGVSRRTVGGPVRASFDFYLPRHCPGPFPYGAAQNRARLRFRQNYFRTMSRRRQFRATKGRRAKDGSPPAMSDNRKIGPKPRGTHRGVPSSFFFPCPREGGCMAETLRGIGVAAGRNSHCGKVARIQRVGVSRCAGHPIRFLVVVCL